MTAKQSFIHWYCHQDHAWQRFLSKTSPPRAREAAVMEHRVLVVAMSLWRSYPMLTKGWPLAGNAHPWLERWIKSLSGHEQIALGRVPPWLKGML
jgi:hypothetical protein